MSAFSGRVALVTGGSRGIGRSVCVQLASQGARVFVNYTRGADAAEETVRLCKEAGGEAESIGFDVADSAAVDAAFEQIKKGAGKIDILVNNAGIAHDGLMIRMKDEEWLKVININLSGAFYCSRAAAKMMMKARYGRIINISSVVGEMGNPGQVPYVSSKAGLIGMTKSVAREFASRGITCNAITPGFIETDMTAALPEEQQKALLVQIPLGHLGKPADIAHAVAYLASPQAAYVTGQELHVNGGMFMA